MGKFSSIDQYRTETLLQEVYVIPRNLQLTLLHVASLLLCVILPSNTYNTNRRLHCMLKRCFLVGLEAAFQFWWSNTQIVGCSSILPALNWKAAVSGGVSVACSSSPSDGNVRIKGPVRSKGTQVTISSRCLSYLHFLWMKGRQGPLTADMPSCSPPIQHDLTWWSAEVSDRHWRSLLSWASSICPHNHDFFINIL